MTYISHPVFSLLLFVALKNILVLLAKPHSGKLRCPDNEVFEFMCIGCVLWWLIRPSFTLNCLLQIEHINSENDDTDVDPLALALRFLHFRSASQTLCFIVICSPSDEAKPLARSCAICFKDSILSMHALHLCCLQDFCIRDLILPLDLQGFSQAA